MFNGMPAYWPSPQNISPQQQMSFLAPSAVPPQQQQQQQQQQQPVATAGQAFGNLPSVFGSYAPPGLLPHHFYQQQQHFYRQNTAVMPQISGHQANAAAPWMAPPIPQFFGQNQYATTPTPSQPPKTRMKADAREFVPSTKQHYEAFPFTENVSIEPVTSMGEDAPPGYNVIITHPSSMPFDPSMPTSPPVAQNLLTKRKKNPVLIVNPVTGLPVLEASSDSGYPSEASTPNSSTLFQLPSTNIPNEPAVVSEPIASSGSNASNSGTLTPVLSVNTPPVEVDQDFEKLSIVTPPATTAECAASKEEPVPPSQPLQALKSQVSNFFDEQVSSLRRSSPSPRSASPAVAESSENLQPSQQVGSMKRSYSRAALLELKSNGSSLPRNASIPRDIALDAVAPSKRVAASRPPAEEMCRALRGILNKMTGDNFDTMLVRIHDLLVNEDDERMKKVDNKAELFFDFIGIIFAKAISEPKLVSVYARMFRQLSQIQFKDNQGRDQTFRRVMLNYCQQQFEVHDHGRERLEELERELVAAKSDAQRKDARENLEEFKNVRKAKYLGNIAFISELYKIDQLSLQIITGCVRQLLADSSEEALESLCKLLRDVGRQMEDEIAQSRRNDGGALYEWWRQECLGALHRHVTDKTTASRIRFFIQDILDARKKGWVFSAAAQ